VIMKRTFLSYTLTLAMMVMGLGVSFAQEAEEMSSDETTEAVADSSAPAEAAPVAAPAPMETADASTDRDAEEAEETGLHQAIKQKFIDGGPFFMAIVLICLILGLALSIERILYLNMASTNTAKLLEEVDSALQSGGVAAAKEVCRNTRGPVASIFYQGLDRADHGIEMVEKSVVSYGSVQMGLLEKGLSWISLFIALAPMLGFFGTVIGMIGAFDAIAAANNISPGIVASGIGVALITTVSGLLVAMVLQVFYNYIVAKVDSIVNEMEDASISLIDIMIKHQMTK
jgi:biopolymer transport protein ExbB